MSGYQVISQASKAISRIFFEALDKAGLANAGSEKLTISLAPGNEEERTLSLWLYLVTENEHARNRPAVFENNIIKPPPLALTLYFLATPGLASDKDADEAISASAEVLGVILHALHTRPVIPLNVVVGGDDKTSATEELHLSLCRLSIEELSRIWEALDHPYRLSVCFRVNVVRIESGSQTAGKPVIERKFITGRLKQTSSR